MTTFPGCPRLLKGVLVGFDLMNPLASVVVFQHNPETATHRLEACAVGSEGGNKAEAYRLVGPPKDTITFVVHTDAAKQGLLKEEFTKRM